MSNSKKKKLILISEEASFPKEDMDRDFYCFFLGRDYEKLLKLKKTLPSNFHYIDIGDFLYATSYKLRRQYIDFIGNLSCRFSSFYWWVSKIAEKNVMDSPVFLYVCYLDIIKQLKGNEIRNKNICIFSESPELLETIYESELFKEYTVSKFYKKEALMSFYLKSCISLIRFAKRSFIEKIYVIYSRIYGVKHINKNIPLTILRTWVGERNLGDEGLFKDSYFVDLHENLKRKGETVAIIPIIYNIKRSYKEAILWFRKAKAQFIIPEDFYSLADYLKTIFIILKSRHLFKKDFVFNDWNLKLIFRQAFKRDFFEGSLSSLIMHYFLVEKLRKNGIIIKKIIIPFENMISEKPLIMGKLKYYSKTKLLGFQHTSIPPLLLSCYTSFNELKVLPLPDKVICSGKFFKEILLKEGYPSNVLAEGPALRYQYLLKANISNSIEKFYILITLPLLRSTALELLSKSYKILKSISDLKVLIKPHPMMPRKELQDILNVTFDSFFKFEITEGNINDLMAQSKLLIATASATILDAIAYGLPVIRVRSYIDLTLDPMDWISMDETQFVARTSEDIGREIKKILTLTNKQLDQIKIRGRQLMESFFSPLTEQTLLPFYT